MKLLQKKLMRVISFTSNIMILTVKTLTILKFKTNFLGLKWKFSFGTNNERTGTCTQIIQSDMSSARAHSKLAGHEPAPVHQSWAVLAQHCAHTNKTCWEAGHAGLGTVLHCLANSNHGQRMLGLSAPIYAHAALQVPLLWILFSLHRAQHHTFGIWSILLDHSHGNSL